MFRKRFGPARWEGEGDRRGIDPRLAWAERQAWLQRHGRYDRGAAFHDGRGQRRFFGRGGPFGPGGPGSRGGPFGPDGPFGNGGGRGFPGGKRFFGRGDLKFALLELLMERPMHGYEMMKALQERSGGRYAASPGSVYPTLQMLEDRGFVSISQSEGKKVYSITDDGRAFLAETQAEDNGERGRRGFWQGPDEDWADTAAMVNELRASAPLFMRALQSARQDADKRRRLQKLIERLRGELSEIAGGSDQYDA